MGRKYERLEGREVVFQFAERSYTGVVTGADWNLGITIQDRFDRSRYYLCINGKASPVMKGMKFNHKLHRVIMAYVYDTVMSGRPFVVDDYLNKVAECDYSKLGKPSAESCAFSQ